MFDDKWDSIEGLIKAWSEDAYTEIEILEERNGRLICQLIKLRPAPDK